MLSFTVLAIFTLFTSIVIQHQDVFAEDGNSTEPVALAEDGNGTKPATLEDECAKKEGNDLDALLCRAVLELQIKVTDLEARMTDTQVVKEEIPEEELGEEIAQEEVEDTTQEGLADSPLRQMVSGVDPHEITCKTGQVLVFKASNWRPSCINESNFDALLARGWIASHDPTHDDLLNMQDAYIATHPQEAVEETVEETPEETVEEQVEETVEDTGEIVDEIVDLKEELPINGTSPDNSTEIDKIEGQTQQQNHSISLREEMEMGSQ
jgi:hypothetical protein